MIAIIPKITIAIMNMVAIMIMLQNNSSDIENAANRYKNAFILYICVLVFCAVLTTAFTIWLWVSDNANQDAIMKDADARIALANAEAAKANEGLAKSNERIAELTKEIAVAKTKQAEAEKALLELQNRLRLRSLTPEQKEKLSSELQKQLIGKVAIYFVSSNEAEQFAFQIAEILHQNNWQVLDCSVFTRIGGASPKGLCIEGRSLTTIVARDLEKTFNNADIEVSRIANPNIADVTTVHLMVGKKP